MRTNRMKLVACVAALAVPVVALSACSSSDPEAAAPTPTKTSAAPAPTAQAGATLTAPAREPVQDAGKAAGKADTDQAADRAPRKPAATPWPEEKKPQKISLTKTAGCQLLGKMSVADFDVDAGKPSDDASTLFENARDCSLKGKSSERYLSVTAVTDEGFEAFMPGVDGDVRKFKAAGFAAATIRLPHLNTACFASVDVAKGQMLFLQYTASSTGAKASQDELCDTASKAATAAVKVLVGS
ncbi:DUF3558 family protein [Actinopolymorpha alba]|uniref:DUF3558 family protein n=1 Tax=Actinopolymorpha alba TaxID=533267 RepID=UPI0003648DDF|nr:DUF3558 family protein [Actinopolymorpha alba]